MSDTHKAQPDRISANLCCLGTIPHHSGKSAHTSILFLRSLCASHKQIPSFRLTVEAQHHAYDVRCQDFRQNAQLCTQGGEMQTQLLPTLVPVFINLPGSLSGNLHLPPVMRTCALAAGLAHCYSIPAIANSSLMWHSQGSLPNYSQLVLTALTGLQL